MCINSVLRTLDRNPALRHVMAGAGVGVAACFSIPAALVAGSLYGISQCFSKPAVRLDGPQEVVQKARAMGSPCQEAQFRNTELLMEIHNKIETAAYAAFADIVEQLGIQGDKITEEQSGKILAHIKHRAHVELFKPIGGYSERFKLLTPEQFGGLKGQLGTIIHDRDTKLTDARYHSLSELLLGLDDHNEFVKQVLIQSWFQCGITDDTHLDYIKDQVSFYPRIEKATGFDLRQARADRAAFWDEHFPGVRAASLDASTQFVRTLEVRNFLGGDAVSYDADSLTLHVELPDGARNIVLSPDVLGRPITTVFGEEILAPRQVHNVVRKQLQAALPLVGVDMTVEQFLNRYFPELTL